ncbi:MAG: SDR family oxidoreductase [Microbacterium sp.]|jgi:NAD(P)-dependent dehydrogenase (short-subunit alcohol dehydrogenase family)|uniref:SDR family oxidoreductase n=1 Tax=Microbacterium sp. TaxID=51671 RepID=UPI0028238CB3|nr:SDR family oxidoreductase [Microbacterium sp.]MDR2322528.1 SDR family oxidoreductase [Microbacterium sp.]
MSGRIAVVTGAGSGIGRAVARTMLKAGYRVALAGRREAALTETAAWRGAIPSNALVVPTDVTVEAEVDALFDRVVQEWGRVDVLFNNAGAFGPAVSAADISLDDWERTLAVNVTGAMLCARGAMRVMRAQDPQGGRIINNGSISAQAPRPLSVAYAVSKHALTGLTRSIDLDGRPFRISCGQIDIGNTRTEIMDELGVGSGALQADGSRRVEPTFDVEAAARTVLFMADLPAEANIGALTVTASGMPFGGRG